MKNFILSVFIIANLSTLSLIAGPTQPYRPVIITGGPGAGKTTIIERLGENHHVDCEVARFLIEDLKMSPADDSSSFNECVFHGEYGKLMHASDFQNHHRVFFDRGMGDVLGYMSHFKEKEEIQNDYFTKIKAHCDLYHPIVFLAPFWSEIYLNDNARKETAEQAEGIYRALGDAYVKLGLTVCLIPKMSVEERINFIHENIDHCPEQFLYHSDVL